MKRVLNHKNVLYPQRGSESQCRGTVRSCPAERKSAKRRRRLTLVGADGASAARFRHTEANEWAAKDWSLAGPAAAAYPGRCAVFGVNSEVEGLSWAASLAGLTLTVLVECDTGAARCGVQTPESAAALARKIVKLPGLHFGGLMTFPTADQSDAFIAATKALLRMDGIPVERVSGGGTPCMWQAHTHPEINEHRAGTYVFGDRHTLKSGAMQLEECAFHVVTTVVSRPTAQRGVLDAGSKCLSSDGMGLEGYGLILEYPQAVIYALSEEHGHVDFSRCARKPAIGERLSILPNHCCPVTNLFDQVIGVRRGKVEVVWPVACRGAVQ